MLASQRSLGRTLLTLLAPLSFVWFSAPPELLSQSEVRVATYNIENLDAEWPGEEEERRDTLRAVLSRLDADVMGLQEIKSREALEQVLPSEDWQVVLDDDSGRQRDLAVAVREPLGVTNLPADLDADDAHFLFPSPDMNMPFPERRDVLAVRVEVPEHEDAFWVLVHHAKSRVGDREETAPRRIRAATALAGRLEHDFHEESVILLGDFNDTPDDCSLNILESGDPDAACGPEEQEGSFMVNLTEPLYADGHVSYGLNSADVHDGEIDTTDPNARQRNNEPQRSARNSGDQLFDQILVTPSLTDHYVGGSAEVFDLGVAAVGNETTRASDHLPVYAEFVFGEPGDGQGAPRGNRVQIASVLPNPEGRDAGHEVVSVANRSEGTLDLSGWTLRDRAGNEFGLEGVVEASGSRQITMESFSMPLNNGGDEIALVAPDGRIADRVRYESSAVAPGVVIRFEP